MRTTNYHSRSEQDLIREANTRLKQLKTANKQIEKFIINLDENYTESTNLKL